MFWCPTYNSLESYECFSVLLTTAWKAMNVLVSLLCTTAWKAMLSLVSYLQMLRKL